jgi:oligosaccharide repeat unit polymerase
MEITLSSQIWIPVLVIAVINVLIFYRIRTFYNPFVIISIFLLTPMLFATLKLSALQAQGWAVDTILIVLTAVLAWAVFPGIVLLFIFKKNVSQISHYRVKKPRTLNNTIIGFSVLFIMLYLFENKKIFGTFIPVLGDLQLVFELHTESLSFLSSITGISYVFAALLFVGYALTKRKTNLIMLLLVVILPLTRLSRVTPFLSLVTLAWLNGHLRVIRFGRKAVLSACASLVVFTLIFSYIGNIRSGRMGEFQFSYGDMIEFKPSYGPLDVFAWAYGYFALPYENLDRFVRANPSTRLYGEFTIMPLINSVLFLQRFCDMATMRTIKDYDNTILVKGVSTSLAYFYIDFGAVGSLFPMLLYMCFFLVSFYKGKKSLPWLIVYCIFASFFSFASFNAIMCSIVSLRSLVFAVVPFAIIHMLSFKGKAHFVNLDKG